MRHRKRARGRDRNGSAGTAHRSLRTGRVLDIAGANHGGQSREPYPSRTSCGFREVGLRECYGHIEGVWHDVILLERRSSHAGGPDLPTRTCEGT